MAYEMAIDFISRICTLPLQLFPAGGDDVSILDNFTFCVNSSLVLILSRAFSASRGRSMHLLQ